MSVAPSHRARTSASHNGRSVGAARRASDDL